MEGLNGTEHTVREVLSPSSFRVGPTDGFGQYVEAAPPPPRLCSPHGTSQSVGSPGTHPPLDAPHLGPCRPAAGARGAPHGPVFCDSAVYYLFAASIALVIALPMKNCRHSLRFQICKMFCHLIPLGFPTVITHACKIQWRK